MPTKIDIRPDHLKIVQDILHKHLSQHIKVFVFGSRATWEAKEYSDLDIALEDSEQNKIPRSIIIDLETAFEESNLPWKVDTIDLQAISKEFKAIIKKQMVVLVRVVMGSDFFKLESIESLVSIHDTGRIPVKKSDRRKGKFPYYGASGIADYIDSFIFDGDYILLSEDGDNLRTRKTPIAFMAKGKFWANNHVHVLKGKNGNNTNFICYALQVADVTSYISGSTRPKITQGDMKKISIYSPPLPEQKAIAHILGSLDDKIELNRQMNETLEAMAQTLFKSWFVDFDPVIDNALAAGNPLPDAFATRAEQRKQHQQKTTPPPHSEAINNLFPNAFEHTETMGWIPKGWEVKKLPDVMDFLEGPGIRNWQYTENEDGIKFINIRCIKDGDLNLGTANKITKEEAFGKYAHFQLEVDDIVVSTSGTLGRYAFIRNEHLPLSLNTSVIRFKNIKNISTLHYIAGYIDTDLQCEIEIRASGSVQRNFGPIHLKQIDMLVPSFKILQKHDEQVDSLFRKSQSNLENIFYLSNIRDTLLPKLLSGKLRIPEAQKLINRVK